MKAIVNKIIPFSSVDGPGNRTAIFLQGCNFNCLYCHNPETINRCIHCGICVEKCPYNALALIDGKVIWNKTLCKNCDVCIKSCQNNSYPKAIEMSVEEVVSEVKKTKSFISGITVSGGECTLQSEFLIGLFKEIKEMGLTTFVDTNGSVPLYENEALLKVMDMAMVDIKAFKPKEHVMLTGRDNDIVLRNVRKLAERNKIYEIRTVIVPEILENIYNVDAISKLIAELNPDIRYKIIKYRPIGVRTDIINSYTPTEDMIQKLVALATKNGCNNVISV